MADARLHDDAARPHPRGAPRGYMRLAEQRLDLMEPRVGLQRLELIRIHPAGLGRRAWLWFRQVLPPRLPGQENARCADRSANLASLTSWRSTQAVPGWPVAVLYPAAHRR